MPYVPLSNPSESSSAPSSGGGYIPLSKSSNNDVASAISNLPATLPTPPAPSYSNTDSFLGTMKGGIQELQQNPSALSEGSTLNNSNPLRAFGNSILSFGNAALKQIYDFSDSIANTMRNIVPGNPAPLTNPFAGNKFDTDTSPEMAPAKLAGNVVGGAIPYILAGEVLAPLSGLIEGSASPIIKYGGKVLINSSIPAIVSQLQPLQKGETHGSTFLKDLPSNLLFGLSSLIPHQATQALTTGGSQFGLGMMQGKSPQDNLTNSAILTLFGFAHGANSINDVKENIKTQAENAPDVPPESSDGKTPPPPPTNPDDVGPTVAKSIMDNATPEEKDAIAKQAFAVAKTAEMKSHIYTDIQELLKTGTDEKQIVDDLQTKYGVSAVDAPKFIQEAKMANIKSGIEDLTKQFKSKIQPENPSSGKEEPVENNKSIVATPDLRTFDFNELEGKPQTDEENAKIHQQIINHPDEPMTPSGKSFNKEANRVINAVKEIQAKGENAGITTHNSSYGVIKLWDEYGQPNILTKKFREEYARQNNTNPTGDTYTIKGKDGSSDMQLIRHGETTDNAKKVFRTPNAQLTEKGKDQATQAGKELKDSGIKKIYSSDLPRAIETSKLVMKEIKGGGQTVPTPKETVSKAQPEGQKGLPERPVEPKEGDTMEEGKIESIKQVDGESYAKIEGKDELTPTSKLTPIGGGEEKVSKLAIDIQAKAIQEKIALEGLESLTPTERMVMKQAEANVDDLYNKNLDQAKRIAFGEEKAPEGINHGVVYAKVRDEAFKNGDIETLKKLASTEATNPFTVQGQNIKGLDAYNTRAEGRQNSATEVVKTMKEVVQTKRNTAETKAKKEGTTVNKKIAKLKAKNDDIMEKSKNATIKDIAKEVKAGKKSSMPKLEAFIKSIPDCL